MARKRFGIEFKGFEEVMENYQKLGGDLKKIASECLDVVPEMVNPNLEKDMTKHNDTHKTANSIEQRPAVEWAGDIGAVPVGFNLKNGGMPSIFLMYGTARHAPKNQFGGPKRANARMNGGMNADRKLYNDIYGAAMKRKIGEKQQEILTKAIKQRLGG